MIGKTAVHGYGMGPYQPLGIMYYGTERGFERTADVRIRNPRAKIESDPENSWVRWFCSDHCGLPR